MNNNMKIATYVKLRVSLFGFFSGILVIMFILLVFAKLKSCFKIK